MLTELTIENFAIIDRLTLEFAPGFNVLTGETGAGKSIILDAVSMLLGARADNADIRSGSERALVEGVFTLSPGTVRDQVMAVIERESLQGDSAELLVLTREIRRGGRNINRVNGHTVTLNILQEIGEGLIDIHGQTEYLSLLKASTHVDLLDRYGGLGDQRRAFAELVHRQRAIHHELDDLIRNAQARKQRAEMLAYQVEEIGGLGLKPGEDDSLQEEARLLGASEQLAEASALAYRALTGSGDGISPAVAELVAEAVSSLARLMKVDAAAKNLYELAGSIAIQVDELVRDLASYQEKIEYDPARLAEIDQRLNTINRLKKKYHVESIAELIALAESAAAEYQSIEGSDERITELRAEEARLLAEIGQAGAALSSARASIASSLSQGVEAELADLRMANARFSVSLEHQDDPHGAPVGDYRVAFDETGIDRVEFLIAPNQGEPLKPLARIASGGETSRIMLALKANLSRADETPTLIFDEIDSGIGGRIGAVVGQKLWSLTHDHQVLVVTHLPQLASFGDRHFKVEKAMHGDRTTTEVLPVVAEKRLDELTAMIGAEAESARQNALEMLQYVEQIKRQAAPP